MVDSTNYQDWLIKGDKDLKGAEILLEYEGDYGIICFHCQQAIEKYLKGYLIYASGFLHQGHSLIKLCKKAAAIDAEFAQYLKDCAYVNDFYIETRYPSDDPMEVQQSEVQESIRIALEMKAFIHEKVNR
ncbi:HEPN domain-containing protein [Anoxynatronum buryatiense]|uniref:HEPN domain-containing protein n=1 Tax=Anoxynatronum buryatiense TaxID=489973 RepID=A0AA45WVZ8_9CLOT|nr:HEPN domain-containing protein [Anoxynatronum buryatiense]SMP56611.1 HEPN domain-containing protein [Anoxynatronum buryatiense]